MPTYTPLLETGRSFTRLIGNQKNAAIGGPLALHSYGLIPDVMVHGPALSIFGEGAPFSNQSASLSALASEITYEMEEFEYEPAMRGGLYVLSLVDAVRIELQKIATTRSTSLLGNHVTHRAQVFRLTRLASMVDVMGVTGIDVLLSTAALASKVSHRNLSRSIREGSKNTILNPLQCTNLDTLSKSMFLFEEVSRLSELHCNEEKAQAVVTSTASAAREAQTARKGNFLPWRSARQTEAEASAQAAIDSLERLKQQIAESKSKVSQLLAQYGSSAAGFTDWRRNSMRSGDRYAQKYAQNANWVRTSIRALNSGPTVGRDISAVPWQDRHKVPRYVPYVPAPHYSSEHPAGHNFQPADTSRAAVSAPHPTGQAARTDPSTALRRPEQSAYVTPSGLRPHARSR
ncbi:hypothetical protein ACIQB5_51765 [Streptomyces sp. NPDC088560]|uniref:hypothetical protein n=1 Tax=Streptomyces sp. NPDC088560 TaxID=3365868 RepID=UPI00381F26DC